MLTLPDSAFMVLRHLAEYRFLTAAQMVRLGNPRSTPRSMSNLLRTMTNEAKLIGCARFGVHPIQGKLENVYYLTPKGVSVLCDAGGWAKSAVKAPQSTTTLFTRDYFHRLACLDFEIAFKLWARRQEFTVQRFDRYFDPAPVLKAARKAPAPPLTSIELGEGRVMIPDAIVQYDTGAKPYLFLLEVTLGRDAGRVIEQMCIHIEALETGAPSAALGFPRGHFVVCLFEYETCMNAVMRYLASDTQLDRSLQSRFLFCLASNTQHPFSSLIWLNWGSQRSPFYGA